MASLLPPDPDIAWNVVQNAADIPSPALLVYPERVEENIRTLLSLVSAKDRLRPHIKTHKLAEVIKMHLDLGIKKFKCATIAEAEMAAAAGAEDILIAYQPVGPNINRVLQLVRTFPQTKFSTLADNPATLEALSQACAQAKTTLEVLIDLDTGMHRSGIPPGAEAAALYRSTANSPNLKPGGLHAYDGHLHQSDLVERAAACNREFAPVESFRNNLISAGLPVPKIVAGGTPTFPIHAARESVECSPGTYVFWDWSYGTKLADLPFIPAALLLTRIVSKPGPDLICLDLGHKAIAAENPHPRAHFLGLEDANALNHSEEHLVLQTRHASHFSVGDCLYAIPRHICPTVALHDQAIVVRHQRACGHWKIAARSRSLTI